MHAVRTPVLGILIAMAVLFGETVAMRGYVDRHRGRETACMRDRAAVELRQARQPLDEIIRELDRLEGQIQALTAELMRLQAGEPSRAEAPELDDLLVLPD